MSSDIFGFCFDFLEVYSFWPICFGMVIPESIFLFAWNDALQIILFFSKKICVCVGLNSYFLSEWEILENSSVDIFPEIYWFWVCSFILVYFFASDCARWEVINLCPFCRRIWGSKYSGSTLSAPNARRSLQWRQTHKIQIILLSLVQRGITNLGAVGTR